MFPHLAGMITLLLFTAIASPQARAAEETIVKVTLNSFKVEMSRTTIPAGTPVTFEVTNKDSMVHEFVVERAGQVDKPLSAKVGGKAVKSKLEDIAAGKTKTLKWTFTQPGAYWAACHVEGHFEAGMKTEFRIVAGAK